MLAVRVPLLDRSGATRSWAWIDPDDADLIGCYRWSISAGYAIRRDSEGRTIPMQADVLGVRTNRWWLIDHINRVRHDNRRCNLRLINAAGNAQNKPHSPVTIVVAPPTGFIDLPPAPSRRGHGRKAHKLTDAQAADVYRRRCAGEAGRALAREFGVSEQHVCNILKGRVRKEASA